MKKISGDVTILIDESGAHIEVRDKNASILLVDVRMAPQNFMAALGRLGHCPAELQVTEYPERIGKTMKVDSLSFPLPVRAKNLYGEECAKIARAVAKKVCPKGWQADEYYGSQNSYFTGKDGYKWARVTIRKKIATYDLEHKGG